MKLAIFNKKSSIQLWCLWVPIIWLWSASTLYGQIADTIQLNELVITSSAISEFGTGARVTKLDSVVIAANTGQSLGEVLKQTSSVYIKSYGNGMLSSISFRGTGSSHTAVLWNGLNIEYPMLGQSDLSVIPIYFSPEVSLQHGSASALYGSGAIGGTVNLKTEAPRQGLALSFRQEFGWFSTFFSGGSLSYAKNNNYVKLKGFIKSSMNDFVFKNPSKPGSPTEKQSNAAYSGSGVDLNAQMGLSSSSVVQMSVQYVKFDREIQPSLNVDDNTDEQQDTNLRARLNYKNAFRKGELKIEYAYLNDNITFNEVKTIAYQNVIGANFTGALASHWSYDVGGRVKFIEVNSPFFTDKNVQETRSSIFGAIKYTSNKWQVSANLRQTIISEYFVPFTPSIGLDYLLMNNIKHRLSIKSQIATGYRVPTLNDRYWQPGGNPNLEPEASGSFEIGFNGSTNVSFDLDYEVTVYHMLVDNWILWLPEGNVWTPQNIKSVKGTGLEFSSTINQHFSSFLLRWSANYAYTRSTNQNGIDNLDRSAGKQLPYVPLNNFNLGLNAAQKHWTAGLNLDFTGIRYVTSDNESVLPAFALLNLNAANTFKLKVIEIVAFLNLNNLLNTNYQNIKNKAMPGFNFNIGFTINYLKP